MVSYSGLKPGRMKHPNFSTLRTNVMLTSGLKKRWLFPLSIFSGRLEVVNLPSLRDWNELVFSAESCGDDKVIRLPFSAESRRDGNFYHPFGVLTRTEIHWVIRLLSLRDWDGLAFSAESCGDGKVIRLPSLRDWDVLAFSTESRRDDKILDRYYNPTTRPPSSRAIGTTTCPSYSPKIVRGCPPLAASSCQALVLFSRGSCRSCWSTRVKVAVGGS
jgi:hypothetical protein